MINIIPLAGKGGRFSEKGYVLPKPLIPISNTPMIIKAIRDIPNSNKWIFIVRKEHINDYQIDILIKSEIPNAIIMPIEKVTEGQACTCMLAKPYLNPKESVFISACDNSYLYDKKKYAKLCRNNNVDCIVWTFTKHETLRRNPTAWGWCSLEEDNLTIKDMSIKTPISKDPYNDHAVVGSFFFKMAKDFIDATYLMIKNNYRINNEFYVDAVPIFLKKMGKRSVIFDVDLYIGWGTPKDLYEYQRIEYFCKYNIKPIGLSEEDKRLFPLWKDYFNKK